MKPGERSFAVLKSSFSPDQQKKTGRIVHSIPWEAARKAARVLFRRFPNSGDVVDIKMVEVSQDRDPSAPSATYYRVTRLKLDKPRRLPFAKASANYTYVVRRLNHSPF